MLIDLIPLIPLYLMHYDRNQESYFFILKLIRINRCLDKFQVGSLMKSIKRLQFDYLAYRIERDNDFALDTVKDNIYITQILITSYFLKTFKLFVFVIGLCYFLSIFFVVLINIESDLL